MISGDRRDPKRTAGATRALRTVFLSRGEKVHVDAKTRELVELALTCALRCTDCTKRRISRALAAGATKGEITEVLLMATFQKKMSARPCAKTIQERYSGGAPYDS